MADQIAYCTEDVTYPLITHAAVVSVSRPDASVALVPNRRVHVKPEDVVRDIKDLESSLSREGEVYTILESCIMLPLQFFRSVPLKKEYWENPTELFSDINRSTPFIHAIYNPSLFSMLITPSKEGDLWRYQAALPISIGSTNVEIERFMLHSDWPVAETAKQCALYKIGQPFLYNWLTHEHAPIPQVKVSVGMVH